MGVLTVLTLVGLALILVGLILLVAKNQVTNSETSKPTLQGPANIVVTGPVGLILIVIGVGCLMLPAYRVSRNDAPTPPHVTPSMDVPSATLDHPVEGSVVSRSKGFSASGSVTSSGHYTVWILDYDGGYTIDQQAVITADKWSAVDAPLGDSSDHLPFDLTMVAILATPDCAIRLAEISATENDYTNSLPDGCTIFGRRTVSVSRP